MSLKLNTAIDFNNRWPLATLPNKKAKVVQTIILDDDDNDISPLLQIVGNKSLFINENTAYTGKIKAIIIREDNTVIDTLEINGTSVLADFGLSGRALFAGEYITNGISGFTKVKTSSKTLKLHI